MAITATLKQLVEERQTLRFEQAQQLMRELLSGSASEVELAALLGAMASRGETAEETAGFAVALREAATVLPLTEFEREQLVDSCGTGGDGAGTFNISTGAALVAAAAGAKVAKHGNRAVTSRCGSADVLEAMEIPINLEPRAAVEALRAHGFCFLLAPAHHPGMRSMMPVRRGLGIRTILNVLGPLLNPAGARRQVMGLYGRSMLRPVAEAMPRLGVRRAMVVHGAGGLDEFALSGTSEVIEVHERERSHTLAEHQFRPEEVGLAPAPRTALQGGDDAGENARILHAIFAGERGPRRDVVVLNAAAVLVVADRARDMQQGVLQASEALDAGAVAALVVSLTRQMS